MSVERHCSLTHVHNNSFILKQHTADLVMTSAVTYDGLARDSGEIRGALRHWDTRARGYGSDSCVFDIFIWDGRVAQCDAFAKRKPTSDVSKNAVWMWTLLIWRHMILYRQKEGVYPTNILNL